MIKFILGIILFIIAWTLFFPVSIVNYFVVLFKSRDHAKGYFLSTAANIDRFANREFRTLWNSTLRKEGGVEFGLINQTISNVLGQNQRDGTLTKTGNVLAAILDFIDKDHCKNSIG